MFAWFSKLKELVSPDTARGPDSDKDEIQFAVAILLIEIMHADHDMRSQEKSVVKQILCEQFDMTEHDANKLFATASGHMENAVSLHEYTSLLNSSFDYQQKLRLINSLWRVAYSDNMLDRYEEHLIRRLADLLYISHADYIREKHHVAPS